MAKRENPIRKKDAESKALEASQAIEDTDLSGVRLAHCTCTQILRDSQLPDKLESRLIYADGEFSKEHNTLAFTFSLQLLGGYNDLPGDQDPPLVIEAIYQARYDVNPKTKLAADLLKEVLRPLGLVHIWPYWREFVQTMTSRMALPPLTLPLLKLPSALEQIETAVALQEDKPSGKKKASKKAAKKSPRKKAAASRNKK